MSENTKIEWADHTFNPWVGCTKVSPACDHCYAESWAKRSGSVQWGGERRRTTPANWKLPLKWNAQAEREGRRFRVFCASLADVFDNQVPQEWRDDLFALIRSTPHLDWLLLTKRIGNTAKMIEQAVDAQPELLWKWPWFNVWIGATICNQEEADRDIPKLLAVPATKRFLSIEPLLGPVDLTGEYLKAKLGEYPFKGLSSAHRTQLIDLLDWVIVGGESGPKARPMHPDWARSLRDQCQAAGVPFMFKQWGEWGPTWTEAHDHLGGFPVDPAGGHSIAGTRVVVRRFANGDVREALWPIQRHGKKAAGRLLDGREWNEVPA